MQGALTAEAPLVGRETELDRIVARLDGPSPAAFVLAGAAGVGKTRLASEIARAAAALGFATARAVASRSAASIPFGPFAPLLPVGGASGDLLGLLRQASEAIAGRAGPDRRLLLVVDDAHLLDDGSAALVHQLVQAESCSVIASVRVPGLAPDPVTALWKDGLADRIDLDPLSEEEVGRVVAGVLGGPVTGGTVRRLWELSEGNALYLRELLIGAVESGTLSETSGIWSLHLLLTAPSRLVELVAARMDGMSAETVAVVELLAAGEPLSLPMLEEMTSREAIEDAEGQGFVELRQDNRRTEARLTHPIYGEALRQTLPRTRLWRISGTLAAGVEATGARRREDLLRVARWQLDAGDTSDPVLLGRAARRAGEMFDFDLAARLAQTALDSGGDVEAGVVLGEAKFRSGYHEDAEAVLSGLVSRCTNDAELARVASARANNLHGLIGDPGAAVAVLDEALAIVRDTAPRYQLLGRLATIRVSEGDVESALSAAEQLLASSDDAPISRGAYVSSIALALLGRTDEAVAVARRGLASHRRASGLTQLPETQLIGGVLGHLAAGHFAQAEADAATGHAASLNAGDKEGQASFLFLTGCVLIERGQLARASRAYLEGASINRELRDPGALRWCIAGQALAEGMSGHPDRAMAAVAELEEVPFGTTTLFDTDVIERGRAWASVAAGSLSRASEILSEAAAKAATRNMRVAEARLLHDIARLGEPRLVAPRLATLAGLVDGELVTALAAHAAAVTRASASDIEAAAIAFEALGASLLEAEALAAAAAIYRSEGSLRRASAAERRAEQLVSTCGNVRTPALSRHQDSGRLTRREREVAGLAGAGASSREIAAELFLSVRTVDNHLQNVYSKLGIAGRDELARALRLPS